MENKYKDVLISTLVKKMDTYLKKQELTDLPAEEYDKKFQEGVNSFLIAHGYPLHCSIGNVIDLLMENGEKVIEIKIRDDTNLKRPIKDRKYTFKSLVKAGPCFNRKLSDVIGRRVVGISFALDEIAYKARKLGYNTFDEMNRAYEEAEKVVRNVQFLKMSYDFIPEEEKKKYFP